MSRGRSFRCNAAATNSLTWRILLKYWPWTESVPGFYRAMLCIARTLLSQVISVRPSVRLSHAAILSKQLNILSNFFHLFHRSLLGTSNARRVWKYRDFRPIFRFISEIIQDRATVIMEGEYETVPSFRMVLVSMTLNDPKLQFKDYAII